MRSHAIRFVPISLLAMLATFGQAAGGNVLVWGTGEPGNFNGTDYILDSGEFDSVTYLFSNDLQTFDTLNGYDKVLYFSNSSSSQDANAIGDVLADFADTGKRLVVATFSWANQGSNTLGGRLISDEISPYVLTGGSLYSTATMSSNDGSPFFDGVNTLSAFYRDRVGLTSGAVSHGTWSDGYSIVASKGNVVGLNLFPNESYGNVDGDYRALVVNTLTEPVPEPATMAALGLGLAAVSRRRRNK